MDLSNLDFQQESEKSIVVQLRHPTSGKILEGATISVKGQQSDSFQSAIRELERKRSKMSAAVALNYDESGKREADDEMLNSSLITGWTGIEEEGKKVAFSTAEAARIIKKYRWIGNQVAMAAMDGSNFLPN